MTTKTADHFSFTKLLVKDLEGTAKFYKEVCGLTELARVESVIAGRPIKEIMFNATGEGAATFVLLTFTDTQQALSDEVILGFMTTDLPAFVERVKRAGGAWRRISASRRNTASKWRSCTILKAICSK